MDDLSKKLRDALVSAAAAGATAITEAGKAYATAVNAAIEAFDHAVVDAETAFSAASSVRLRQFAGDVEPVEVPVPSITPYLPGTPGHEAAVRRVIAEGLSKISGP